MVCKVNIAKTAVYEGPHKQLSILVYRVISTKDCSPTH